MVTKSGRVIRTDSIRVALNDLRVIQRRDGHGGDLPARVPLDDGTSLYIAPFIATEKTMGYKAGTVVPGLYTVVRCDATGARLVGHREAFIP